MHDAASMTIARNDMIYCMQVMLVIQNQRQNTLIVVTFKPLGLFHKILKTFGK